jgi:poly-beta-1,6-N-acetyl-D-glucosamine N-deacetylase
MRLRALLALGLAAVCTVAADAAGRSAIAPSSDQRLPGGQQLLVLCWHDVVPVRLPGMDPETIETAVLASQLNWLTTEHYVAVDLDAVERAYAGGTRLPERAVLLTFDDGYESTYTQVFPLLQAFRMPAVVALVGQWMQTPADSPVQYGDRQLPRGRFMSWDQARRMRSSGLIEFASHTWDLHRGLAGDPGGSQQPAATTHRYSIESGYEDDAAWQARVRSDLARNSELLERQLGQRPRAIAWPYGRYNHATEQIARELGMPIGLTLDAGRQDHAVPMSRLRRLPVDAEPSIGRFARLVRQQDEAPIFRALQVDLDGLPTSGGADLERALDPLLAQIRALGLQTVVLRAFAVPAPGAGVGALYFHNRHLPVRGDLLGRVAWKIAASTPARVWAWMPAGPYALPSEPADPDERRRVGDLFEDLGKAAYLSGILIAPPSAGMPAPAGDLGAELSGRLAQWQPQLRTAWKLDADGEATLTGRIRAVLDVHDYAVIDPPPGATQAGDAGLAALVNSVPDGTARTAIALEAHAGAVPAAVRRAQSLAEAGLPNLVLFGPALLGSDEGSGAIRPIVSMRTRLAREPAGGLR